MKNLSNEKAQSAFNLLAGQGNGVLSTISLAVEGYPFGSITPYCLDEKFNPILLISSIAQHTKNIEANSKVSLTIIEENSDTNKQAKAASLTLEMLKRSISRITLKIVILDTSQSQKII